MTGGVLTLRPHATGPQATRAVMSTRTTSSRAGVGQTGPDLTLRRQRTRPGLVLTVWIDSCFHRGLCSFERAIFASSITSPTAVTASAMLLRSLAYFRRGCVAQERRRLLILSRPLSESCQDMRAVIPPHLHLSSVMMSRYLRS